MATLAKEFRHWTREEYERLVAEGFFQPDERLEVMRDPQNGVYRWRTLLRAGNTVSPPERPEMSIAVTDLLP